MPHSFRRCFDNAYLCGPGPSDEEATGGPGGGARRRARGRGGGDGEESGSAEGPASDIVPSVYQRAEYGLLVQAFLSSFDRLHRAGLLDQRRVVQIMWVQPMCHASIWGRAGEVGMACTHT